MSKALERLYILPGYQWSDARARLLRQALANDEAEAIVEFVDALLRVAEAAERVANVKQPTSGPLGVALSKLDFALDALAALDQKEGEDG